MLIALLFAAHSLLAQSVLAQSEPPLRTADRGTPARHSASSRDDSARIVRSARRAQERFESLRRRYLPREFGHGSHHCDVVVGRWCVWNDETNDREPPPESPRIRDARLALLATLDTLGNLQPQDEWIAGQQVRYLIEAKRHADAADVALRCLAAATSSYYCRALGALALHDSGAVQAADSAFADALSAMDDSTRCRWTDISLLLDSELERRYSKMDCSGRNALAASYWRLGAPLFLLEPDWRNEFFARVTRTELARSARSPMGSPNDDAYRETALRYGFDTWYVIEEPPLGSMSQSTVAGYRSQGPGYNFTPGARVFAFPESLSVEDWDLKLRSAQAMYAPTYLRHLLPLPRRQIAVFRRGDTAVVTAAYDVREDTLLARHPLRAGLFGAPVDGNRIDLPLGTVDSSAGATGVLAVRAPWKPMIVSLELFDRETRSAARARIGIPNRDVGSRIGVSDLLLFAPADSTPLPQQLGDALPRALATHRITANRPLGIFWETYGVRPGGEVLGVTLTIERVREAWWRRAAQRVGLASSTSPLHVQWQEVPDRSNRAAPRAIAVDLSRLAEGHYRVRLTVSPRNEPPVVATREIVVER